MSARVFPSYLDFLEMLRDRHHWAKGPEVVRVTTKEGQRAARVLLGVLGPAEQAATCMDSTREDGVRPVRRRFTCSILDRSESFLGNNAPARRPSWLGMGR